MADLGKSGQASRARNIQPSVQLLFLLAFMDVGLFIYFRGLGTSPEIIVRVFFNPLPWEATDRSE